MKKIFTLAVAALVALGVSASEYEQSVGMVAGLGIGVQYKTIPLDNFTIIEEFGFFTNLDGATGSYAGAIDNLVLAYQAKGTEGEGIQLDWYVGGQIKVGYGMGDCAVFGVGAAAGFEANMKKAPIAFSFDFRPGYALRGAPGFIQHMFDYSFNLGVRYTIPMPKKGKK